ncbi:MAG: DJ-1/PfpI family protein [Chloroflexi bacterium]|nr:DJ-1/PfpI family protein [Chloroflexota bacterium]
MPRTVAIVLYENAEELDWAGPWEVFTMLKQLEPGSCEVVSVSEGGGEVRCAKGLRVLADYSFATCPAPDILVVPGGHGSRKEMESPPMLDFVRGAAEQAEVVTSVCTGAFVLWGAGLLAGKRATTHWGSMDYLRKCDGVTAVDERWVDEGAVITAAGVSAGIDMSLHLVGRLWSPLIARRVQKAMEYFPAPPYEEVEITWG